MATKDLHAPSVIDVEIHYPAGHSYEFQYAYSPGVFCVNCGTAEVYTEQGEGDYYVGPTSVCLACYATFTFQGGDVCQYWPTAQVICQLREARGLP